jgi:hypothetical protein
LRHVSQVGFIAVRRTQRLIKIWLWLFPADVFVGAFSLVRNTLRFMGHGALLRRNSYEHNSSRGSQFLNFLTNNAAYQGRIVVGESFDLD